MKQFFRKYMPGVLIGMLLLAVLGIAAIGLYGCGKQANASMAAIGGTGNDTVPQPSVASTGYCLFSVTLGNYTGGATKVSVAHFRAPWPLMLVAAQTTCQNATGRLKVVMRNKVTSYVVPYKLWTSVNQAMPAAVPTFANTSCIFTSISTAGQFVSDAVAPPYGLILPANSDVYFDVSGLAAEKKVTNLMVTLVVQRR